MLLKEKTIKYKAFLDHILSQRERSRLNSSSSSVDVSALKVHLLGDLILRYNGRGEFQVRLYN